MAAGTDVQHWFWDGVGSDLYGSDLASTRTASGRGQVLILVGYSSLPFYNDWITYISIFQIIQKNSEKIQGIVLLLSASTRRLRECFFVQRFCKGKHPSVQCVKLGCPQSAARPLPSTLMDTRTIWIIFPPCLHFGHSCLHFYRYRNMLITAWESVQRDTHKWITVVVSGLGLELPGKQG